MHFPNHQQFMSCKLPDLEVIPLYLITLHGFLWLLKIREPWIFDSLALEHILCLGLRSWSLSWWLDLIYSGLKGQLKRAVSTPSAGYKACKIVQY